MATTEKVVVKKMKFARKDSSGNTDTLTCFENGRIVMVNQFGVVMGLSNVMFNAGLKTGYQGEGDTLKAVLRDAIIDYSDENAKQVLAALQKITKLNDWSIVA